MLYPRMFFEPPSDHDALLVGPEIVGDQIDKPLWDGPLYLLQQLQVALGVSPAGGESDGLAILDSKSAEDPHLVWTTTVLQGRFEMRCPATTVEPEGKRAGLAVRAR
jgi:hypothetical protein